MSFLEQREVSQRRGCALVSLSRSVCRYQPLGNDDEQWTEKLRLIAQKHPRCGYRRAWAELRRAGERINKKKVHRLWKKAGLSIRVLNKKRKRKKGKKLPLNSEYPNHVWTYDIMHDCTQEGRSLRVLTVIDEFTRECLAIRTGRRMPAKQVLNTLCELFSHRSAPIYLRSDNGSEFTANLVRGWLERYEVQTWHIDPGKPWQNPFGESFNGTFRAECLNMELFTSVQEAQVLMEKWRSYYNSQRPHSSLGYQTPLEFAANWSDNQPLGLPLSGMKDYLNTEKAGNLALPFLHSPDSALGSHPCGALSSEPATNTLTDTTRTLEIKYLTAKTHGG